MKYDNVILGEGCIYSSNCDETQINNNIIVCGSSGCGKSMSISEPRLLETKNSNLIMTVSKRKLIHKYKPLFIERGYNVLDLNFVSPEESNVAYDPLDYVASYADITFLAESIVKLDPKKKDNKNSDPFWDESSTSLLSAFIAYTLATKDDPTFADVLDMQQNLKFYDTSGGIISTNMDSYFEAMAEQTPDHFAVTCWRSFKNLPIKTAACTFSSLNVVLDTVFSPELREMMRKKNKINFAKMANEKTVLFVTTSAVNPSLNAFVNMFYSQVIKSLFEYAEKQPNGALPIPTHLLCDDFAVGAPIHLFSEYISIFREKKISATILLQSESQLEAMYGYDNATTIINNCDSYIFLGGMDLKTCKNVSEKLNVPLEEVLYMPIGQLALFRRGQKPIITKRYNILANEMYKKITREYEGSIEKRSKIKE